MLLTNPCWGIAAWEAHALQRERMSQSGKEVLYITERAVFRLTENGLELEEYAPGVNVVKDIMKKMEFEPKISINLKEMDKSIFEEKRMNIGAEIQQLLG
ncbi:MAG: hypothetical protein ACP5FU_06660 [Nitrososphaeria archaeon]